MNPTDMQGMSWGVHTMGPMMRGRNFLSWHRQFVLRMELRLQKVHAGVAIPYWDAVKDRSIPAALTNPTLLASWGVTRQWNPSLLPEPADVVALNGFSTFTAFQSAVEGAVHGGVHNAVGGDMATAASPSDPLFWLHHANIDRLWTKMEEATCKRASPEHERNLTAPAVVRGQSGHGSEHHQARLPVRLGVLPRSGFFGEESVPGGPKALL